ncbi:MAG: hypothetical protein KDD69_15615 [Bdellovibrionales bacterium]|nr:hypothetical protein [Bdellovibrionales bacterium]
MKKLGLLLILLVLLTGVTIVASWGRAASDPVPQGAIVLAADSNDGHDPAWEKRHYYGKATWGIRGSGKVEAGEMWFSAFPGPSGEYRVSLDVIAEQDGSPPYRVLAENVVLSEGVFPYPSGARDCDARGRPMELDLGEHRIEHGSKIRVWGQSVYECGEKGAYALWYRLVFTPVTNTK